MRRFRTLLAAVAALTLAKTAAADAPSLDPYGFVRLDCILNDSPMNHPQFPMWVLSEVDDPADPGQVAKDKGEISIHPRLTRLGFDIEKTTVGNDIALAGTVEVDFQNGGSESREALRARHAYFTVARGTWEILAGQTWDLMSPLYPYVNHDGMMWNAGNAGDRRPQLRFSVRPEVGEGKARLAVGLAMPNAINNRDLDGNGVRDGAYSLLPAIQGLAEVDLPVVRIGVSGHFHRDRVVVDTGSGLEEKDFDATLVGGHLKIPIGDRITLLGEGFWAENADDMRAGIGQGINLALEKGIRTVGGWGEVQVKASEMLTVAAGATLDDPDDDDLSSGMRSRNQVIYGALRAKHYDRLQVGLEYLHWKTDYLDAPDGDANRVDLWGALSF